MASKFEPDDDNPIWTDADFTNARPITDLHSGKIIDLLIKPRGRPASNPSQRKKPVSIRLDQKVIAHFKAGGPGWQSRLNDFLVENISDIRG